MKKVKIVLVFTLILMTFVLSSCSDDKKDEDYDKVFNKDFIVDVWYDDEWEDHPASWTLDLYSNCSIPLNSAVLKVNNQTAVWESGYGYDDYDYYKRSYSYNNLLVKGQTFEFILTVDGVTRKGNLKMPYSPKLTAPSTTFDHTKDYTINWTITENCMLYTVELYDAHYVEYLKSTQRSYTIPAGLLNENRLHFILNSLNYTVSGNVLFAASGFDGDWRNKTTIKQETQVDRKAKIEMLLRYIDQQ